MGLINKEDTLAAIMDDGGLQYPRWWYVEKVKEMPELLIPDKVWKRVEKMIGAGTATEDVKKE